MPLLIRAKFFLKQKKNVKKLNTLFWDGRSIKFDKGARQIMVL